MRLRPERVSGRKRLLRRLPLQNAKAKKLKKPKSPNAIRATKGLAWIPMRLITTAKAAVGTGLSTRAM